LLLYIIEMSQPISSCYRSSLSQKLKLQAQFASNNLLIRILKIVYQPQNHLFLPTVSEDCRCESACDIFIELVDELCHQEKDREIHVNKTVLKGESVNSEILNDNSSSDESFSSQFILQNGVGAILSTLVLEIENGNNDYILEMLQVINNYEVYSYTCRRCCLKILYYLVERTFSKTKGTNSTISSAGNNKSDSQSSKTVKSLRKIHEFLMKRLTEHFSLIYGVILREYELSQHEPVQLSAYTVSKGFSTLRMNLIQLLLQMVRFSYLCLGSEDGSTLLLHVEAYKDKENDLFKPLIDWFFDYRFNNMYHNLFSDLMSEIIYSGEDLVLWCILSKHRFITRAIRTYKDNLPTDNRGHILYIFNLLRLTADTLDRSSFLFHFLSTHQLWNEFHSTLMKHTLREICKTDERDIMIGSEFAEELGFYENDQYHKTESSKGADQTSIEIHTQLDEADVNSDSEEEPMEISPEQVEVVDDDIFEFNEE
jgi:hypothetical protein